MNYSKILTKKFLIKEYIQNKKSTIQIAEEIGCSYTTISSYLKKYNISIRTINESNIGYANILTKKFLIKEYIKNKKSSLKIAKEVGCDYGTVLNYLKKYNLPRRTISEANKGKNCHFYEHGKTLKQYACKDCGKEISYGAERCKSCARKEEYKAPENTPNWQGGISFEPYPVVFNNFLKEQIRERDNHQCQICGKLENGRKLDVHHIDYNKNNLNPENLISLCKSCHMKTNGNREIYMEYFGILKVCIK